MIGLGTPETQKAQDEIDENTEDQVADLKRILGDEFSAAAVVAWEKQEERNLCLANHVVIGTDFSGAHWVYDTRSRRKDGEMTLVHWDISYGAQDPKFGDFYAFLDWAAFEASFRLRQLKSMLGSEPESEQRPSPPRKRRSGAPTKRSPKKGPS